MTRKKKQQPSTAGVYALCITVGVIVGLGLAPIMNGSMLVMILIGAGAGAITGYILTRNKPKHPGKHHH